MRTLTLIVITDQEDTSFINKTFEIILDNELTDCVLYEWSDLDSTEEEVKYFDKSQKDLEEFDYE